MRLEHIPSIPPSTLSALHAARLRTVSHVLSLPNATLLQLTSLPPSSLSSLLSQLHAATAARPILPVSLHPSAAPVTSGSLAFDAALTGGLHPRTIIQLAGSSVTGKTQTALALAANALRSGAVVWLDSSSTHAIFARVAAILAAQRVPQSDAAALLRRLILLPASSVDRALACLRALRKDVLLQRTATGVAQVTEDASEEILADALAHLRLLVFDSVANVLAPVLGLRDGSWSGHVALNHVAVELRWFASHADVSVLVTNRVVRDGSRTKPALGNSWAGLVDVNVAMQTVGDNSAVIPRWDDSKERVVIKANIASKRACKRMCKFQICEEGIRDVDTEIEEGW